MCDNEGKMMKKFKNDKERILFLEERRTEDGWRLWRADELLDRRMWRYDMPGAALIVEEIEQTIHWPKDHVEWTVDGWYIMKDGDFPFADWRASRTLALQELKRCEKEGLL